MLAITPLESARLADAVYGIKSLGKNPSFGSVEKGLVKRVNTGVYKALAENWDFEAATVGHGDSGMFGSENTGFAMVVPGRGVRSGQTAVLFRGTKTANDWGTDFNFIPTGSHLGNVHSGFLRTYKSIQLEGLFTALQGRQNSQLHIIGHSLGGALANLMALDHHKSFNKKPMLYTFGSPRVGLNDFSLSLEHGLGAENIFRVYDVADPVPLVPTFPYIHSAQSVDGIRVGNSGGLINIPSHFMDNYIPKVKAKNNWQTLSNIEFEQFNMRNIDGLLSSASQTVKIPGASIGLWTLGKVLQALIDMAFLLASPASTIVMSVVDHIANMLNHAGRLSRALGNKILKFMEMVFQWMGRKVNSNAIELTTSFLKYIINLLMTPLMLAAKSAMTLLGK